MDAITFAAKVGRYLRCGSPARLSQVLVKWLLLDNVSKPIQVRCDLILTISLALVAVITALVRLYQGQGKKSTRRLMVSQHYARPGAIVTAVRNVCGVTHGLCEGPRSFEHKH